MPKKGGYRPTEWAYLVREKPAEARARILDAYRETKGNATHAAKLLGISYSSLMRYVNALNLDDAISAVRIEAEATTLIGQRGQR